MLKKCIKYIRCVHTNISSKVTYNKQNVKQISQYIRYCYQISYGELT